MAASNMSEAHNFPLVGWDDVLVAATYALLTTVSSRSDEAGRVCITLLHEMLSCRSSGNARLVLDTHVVARRTTPDRERIAFFCPCRSGPLRIRPPTF